MGFAVVIACLFASAQSIAEEPKSGDIVPYPFAATTSSITSVIPATPESKDKTETEEQKTPAEKKADEATSTSKSDALKPLPAPLPPIAIPSLEPAPVTPEALKKATEEAPAIAPVITPPTSPAPAVMPPSEPVTPESLKKAVETTPAPAPLSPVILSPSEPVPPVTPEVLKKASDTGSTTAPTAPAPTPPPAPLPPAAPTLAPKAPEQPIAPEVLKKSPAPVETTPPTNKTISSPPPAVTVKKTQIGGVHQEPSPPIPVVTPEKEQPKPVKPKKKKAKKKEKPQVSETTTPPPAVDPNSAFTPETMQIFDVIESSLGKSRRSEPSGKVNVQRDDYVTSLSEYKNPESENIGIKVNVKKADADIMQMQSNAHNALMLGQYETSVALYKEVLKADKNSQTALLGLAAAYQKSGDTSQAKTIYGKLLSLYPDNPDAINNFLSLTAEEAPAETLAKLKSLEKINPKYGVIPAQIGLINSRLGNQEDAARYLRRAISLAPDNLAYRYNLAIVLDRAGEYPQAAALYRQLVDEHQKGNQIPGNVKDIQERLTYLGSK